MQGDIKLFIGGMQVDMENDPHIYYNWQTTDFDNPTATKNSFSKTITLPGTARNNDVFGHFWELDRQQLYGGNSGAWFNATYRVPFELFINGDMFEKGYVKLQKVQRNLNGECEYEIGFFGGLGSFLYNLTTDWNSGEKKTLGDLKYYIEDTEQDLGFTINKDTVKDAWDNIDLYSSKWSIINFAPSYNGLNDKMSNDKAVVNYNDLDVFVSSTTEDGITYTPSNGFALASLPEKLTEWESCDLRAWCQRPVVRVKSVIEAIAKKVNNQGKYDNGYELELDPEFFSTHNPYFEESWLTLPQISSLNIKTVGETKTSYTASPTNVFTGTDYIEVVYSLSEPVELFGTNAELEFDLGLNVPNSNNEPKLYPSGVWKTGGGWWIFGNHNGQLKFTNVYAVQGLASLGTASDSSIVAGSDVYWLQYNRTDKATTLEYTFQAAHSYPNGFWGMDGYSPRWETDICQTVNGYFVQYSGKVYRWNSKLKVVVPLPIGATSFRIRVDRLNAKNTSISGNPRNLLFKYDGYGHSSDIVSGAQMTSGNTVLNRTFTLASGNLSNFYSGQEISQKDLLSTTFSPGEFLMDYCRMFGLFIHKDLFDDKIYIDTRNTYYRRNNIKDISDKLDWGNGGTISPTLCVAGYYRMKDSYWEGGAYKDYQEKYGQIYGNKTINTGYEFDADTKDLISSKLKGAVQVRGNGKYYFAPWVYLHPYVFDGLKYTLYAGGVATGDTKELEIQKKVIVESFDPFRENQPFYDIDDRPEFCDASKKPLGGDGVMLFHIGSTDLTGMYYYLTDDIDAMSRLNNNPCYLLTGSEYDKNGNKIANLLSYIPKFSRYWYSPTYRQGVLDSNNILYSLDFGSPRQIYLLDYNDYEKSNLYSQFYKSYYEDMFDANTKALTIGFVPGEIMNAEWLRDFYWFNNSIWRLNKVVDYSPLVNDVVKCEFVKVQDLDNMTNEIPSKELELTVVLDRYTIDGNGGTIIGTVSTSDMGSWFIENWDYDNDITISPLSYHTDGTFTVSVPSWYGPGNRVVGITVGAGDITQRVYFTQTPLAGSNISISADTPIPATSTSVYYTATTNTNASVKLLKNNVVIASGSVSSGTTTGSFPISANTGTTNITYVVSAITNDNVASATTNVVQNGASTPPTPPGMDYDVSWGIIALDKDHNIDGYMISDGSISVSEGLSTLSTATVYGDATNLVMAGMSFSGNNLTNCTLLFDFSNMTWNTALHPDIKIDITLNNDITTTMTYSGDNLQGGVSGVDLTQYASGNYIILDFYVSVRDNNP